MSGRLIGTLRRVRAVRDEQHLPDPSAIARQVEQSASSYRLPDGQGPRISISLSPGSSPIDLPEPGASLTDWLKQHFTTLTPAELMQVAEQLAPVVEELRREAAQATLSRGGDTRPVVLLSAWPGLNNHHRAVNMLRATRGNTFARLSWEERLAAASRVLRENKIA